jgi:hypothetical protein
LAGFLPAGLMLDRPGLSLAEAERSLRELDQVNRLTLGSLPLRRTLLPRLGRWSRPRWSRFQSKASGLLG